MSVSVSVSARLLTLSLDRSLIVKDGAVLAGGGSYVSQVLQYIRRALTAGAEGAATV